MPFTPWLASAGSASDTTFQAVNAGRVLGISGRLENGILGSLRLEVERLHS